MQEIGIMDVGGFQVGHAPRFGGSHWMHCHPLRPDEPRRTGCPGRRPASRESQILNPVAAAEGINAVLLSGGSAFGLDAAAGVQRYLEERGIGFDTGVAKVPLVSQSCLFDLGVGSKEVRPTADMAYQACENGQPVRPALGNVGAGTGCSLGKVPWNGQGDEIRFRHLCLQAGPVKVGAWWR